MGYRVLSRGLVAVISGVVLLATVPAAHGAPNPGTVLASTKVRDQIVRDIGATEPSRCYAPVLAKSDRNWGLFSPNLGPSGCDIRYYAIPIVHKVKGKWKRVGVPPEPKCAWLKDLLMEKYKAPVSVIEDFKAVGFCT